MAARTPNSVIAHIRELHEAKPELTALEIKRILNLSQAETTVWRIIHDKNKFHNLSSKIFAVPPGHCVVCGENIQGHHYRGTVRRNFFFYRVGMHLQWLCLTDYCLLFREGIIDRDYETKRTLYKQCTDCEHRTI